MFEKFLDTPKNLFGLDIGYKSIKVVELKKGGKFYNLSGFGEVVIRPGSIQKNGIAAKEELAKLIKHSLDIAKPKKIVTKNACSALSASMVFSKILKLPQMKKAELDKAIPFEAADFFPIPLSELNLDWHILNSNSPQGAESEIEVMVFGAPKVIVKDLIAVTKLAGLNLMALETKPISTARAIIDDEKSTVVLVDIGAEITSISIYDQGTIKITVTIKTGGDVMVKDMSASLGIGPEAAEKIIFTQGLELDKNNEQNSAIINNIQLIVNEIDQNIKYYENRINPKAQFSKILLAGGGSELANIDKFIESKLGIPTVIANPWTKIKARHSDMPSAKDALKYSTAIGLAMREL